MAKIISFFNHKGGVGKTTTVHNLSCVLKNLGQKVLVIDADPQMNLTAKVYGLSTSAEYTEEIGNKWRDFNASHTSLDKLIYKIFRGDNSPINIYEQSGDNEACLHLIPSSFDLAQLETEIVDIVKRNNQLDKGKLYDIEKYIKNDLGDKYDFILIDFSPSASSLINGILMMLSDYFIVPTSPTLFCIQAIDNLTNVFQNWSILLEAHRKTVSTNGLSFSPQFLGIIVAMAKRRTYKGETGSSAATKKWIELVNESVSKFQIYNSTVGRSVSEDFFKEIFPEKKPFIIDESYDFTLELRTTAELKGTSEFDLQNEDLPNQSSKRQDGNGAEIYVNQYHETLKTIKETYTFIAQGLIKLKK